MKPPLLPLILLAGAAGFVSCVTPAQGTGSVENLERQAPVTPLPSTGEGDFARAAAQYSSGGHYNRSGRRGWWGY